MDINSLINRSKESFEDDPLSIDCKQDNGPLVSVEQTKRLILDPIWNYSDNDTEGNLYKDFMEANPSYKTLLLRQEVARRLYSAARNLPSNLTLILRAGHRPMEVQQQELKLSMQTFLNNNHEATEYDALMNARTFIDDPAIKLPSHCCGSAVDVDVFDNNTNKLVDFGCPINTNAEVAFINTNSISEEQKNNRLALLTAMLKAGFAPTVVEWWHFSYGDTVWAYFYAQQESLYGLIEPAT